RRHLARHRGGGARGHVRGGAAPGAVRHERAARAHPGEPGMTAATDRLVYTPAPGELGYTFGGRPPVASLRPGQVAQVATEDCFGGLVRTPADLPSQVCTLPYVNPVSGPFYVEDAEPGDTLAVHVV